MKWERISKKPVWRWYSEGEGTEAPDEAEEVTKVYTPMAMMGGEQDVPPCLLCRWGNWMENRGMT